MSILHGRRILVVEDEFLIAAAIEDALSDAGASIVGPASRAGAALALLEAENIDAAVLDLNLIGETSEGVAAALRARAIPFVMTTGYGESARVSALAANAILDKPYPPEALVQKLGQIFAR